MTHPYTRLFTKSVAPTVNDDISEGYERGDVWDHAGGSVYDCRDATEGTAVWDERGGGSFNGDVTGAFQLSGDITPPALTATTHDYNPTGLATAGIIRASTDSSPHTITGLQGGADGRIIIIMNVGSPNYVSLAQEGTGSSAANRFKFEYGLAPGEAIAVIYDATDQRWKSMAPTVHSQLAGAGGYTHATINGHIDNTSNPHSVTAAQAGAAAAVHTHSPTTGESVLGGQFNITGAAGVHQATGLSVTLPSAGTYKLKGDIRGRMIGNAGTAWWVHVKLRNTTDNVDITNSDRLLVLTGTSGLHLQNTIPLNKIVTTDNNNEVIEVWAARNGSGSPSWTGASIESNSSGYSTLSYEKIG